MVMTTVVKAAIMPFVFPDGQSLYTTGEVASVVGVTRQTVWNWIRRNGLPAFYHDGIATYLLRSSDVEEFMWATNRLTKGQRLLWP